MGRHNGSRAGHTLGAQNQVVSAVFSPDGSRVVTASVDGTVRVWLLDPIILIPANQRQGYVCRERLIGARSFTDREMQDPMLSGSDDLRDPCNRGGPFNPDYYWRATAGAVATIQSAISK